jgi:hypothetical protein
MDKYVASRLATPGSPGPLANRPAGRTREPVIALHCSVASGAVSARRSGHAMS